MPLYEYQCDACGRRFEVIQKFSDPVLETCRLCAQGPVRRLLSSPAIQFKGSGWYINDSRGASSSTVSGDSAKAETKAETKAEPKAETSEKSTKSEPSSSSASA